VEAEAVHYEMCDAKTVLSRIIERVECGEEVINDRAGTPVAKVVPLVRRTNRTAIGSLAGQVDLSGDWDAPHNNAEIAPTSVSANDAAARGTGSHGNSMPVSRMESIPLCDVDTLKV
jgi:antitoxin (DNA-binding transcriptional repressor) of toxin-antitoxin stability system